MRAALGTGSLNFIFQDSGRIRVVVNKSKVDPKRWKSGNKGTKDFLHKQLHSD